MSLPCQRCAEYVRRLERLRIELDREKQRALRAEALSRPNPGALGLRELGGHERLDGR